MPYQSNADLPAAVKKLPSHGQTIYRSAFNSAYEQSGGDESRAHATAWAAVKNRYRQNEEGEWVAKDSEAIARDGCEAEWLVSLDADANMRLNDRGFLLAFPRVARTGIQVYAGWELGRDDVDRVRVYRPPEVLFDPEKLRSFSRLPLTNDHPRTLVDAANWRQHAVGTADSEMLRDGEFLRIPIMVQDASTVDAVKRGKAQLSAGYQMALDWTPGQSPEGEAYDARMTDYKGNHIAIVSRARGGPSLRIGDDRGEIKMPQEMTNVMVGDQSIQVADVSAGVLMKHLKGLETQISELQDKVKRDKERADKAEKDAKDAADALTEKTTALSTKDAEIVTLKKQIEDGKLTPQKLDEIVKDRAEAIGQAKKLIGDKLVVDGKTTEDIRRQVVEAKVGQIAKDWSVEQVTASFNTLTAKDESPDALTEALNRRRIGPVAVDNDARETAYDEYCKELEKMHLPDYKPAAA